MFTQLRLLNGGLQAQESCEGQTPLSSTILCSLAPDQEEPPAYLACQPPQKRATWGGAGLTGTYRLFVGSSLCSAVQELALGSPHPPAPPLPLANSS